MEKTKEAAAVSRHLSLEDMALKTAAQYFGKELLPCLGIREPLSVAAPTEQVHLEARRMYEDFNYQVVGKRRWIHLEFESDSIRNEDLKRFREYEAVTSRTFNVEVMTYVICSSNVKKLRTELREGFNTYRVRAVRLKNRDSDQLFERILARQKAGETLTKADLVPVLLSPLMSGTLDVKDRIVTGLKIVRKEAEAFDRQEAGKMEAVLYALASKFLNRAEMREVKEVIEMTVLGEMIRDDGIQIGLQKGMQKGLQKGLQEGTERVNRLNRQLLKDKRMSDLERALDDPEYQKRLLEEYGIN